MRKLEQAEFLARLEAAAGSLRKYMLKRSGSLPTAAAQYAKAQGLFEDGDEISDDENPIIDAVIAMATNPPSHFEYTQERAWKHYCGELEPSQLPTLRQLYADLYLHSLPIPVGQKVM